jgi:hypothetical protein
MPQGLASRAEATRDAVVFSSYVPNGAALAIATEYLSVLERCFADCDVYVGINSGSITEWERLLRASPLRVRVGTVEPRLAVDSDVSGFQKALELMRDEGRTYDLVWFGHTKGATRDEPALRRQIIGDFFMRRERISRLFRHPRVGAFGHDATAADLAAADTHMDAVFPFPYRSIGTFYLFTFYVLRGSIVKTFLDGCSEDFFTKNLVSDLGFDRYFFERDFGRLCDRFGYYPLHRERHRHLSPVPVTRSLVRGLYRAWEKQLPEELRARIWLS